MYKTARERRPKSEIRKATLAYVEALKAQFPWVEPEIVWEGIEGFDVWVRVPVAEDDEELVERLMSFWVKLEGDVLDETGVMIVTTPTVKEPAA